MCVRLGEACWWTIHPASKQRSEGEKVRVGDDLILVSVSSERYLVHTLMRERERERERERDVCLQCFSLSSQHLSYGYEDLHVDAAFQQTLWSVVPICSGSEVAQGTPAFTCYICSFVCLFFRSFIILFVCCSLPVFLAICLVKHLCPYVPDLGVVFRCAARVPNRG